MQEFFLRPGTSPAAVSRHGGTENSFQREVAGIFEEGIASVKLTVEEYAALRGCTIQYVRRLCAENKLDHEVSEKARGGRSGISYRIPLTSLPDKEIRRYLRKRDREQGSREGTAPQSMEAPEPPVRLDYERLSAQERQELNRKNKILDDWTTYRQEEKQKGKSLAEADENYVRVLQLQYPDMPMSLRTIRRWDGLRRKSGEAALVDSRGRHGKQPLKMRQEVFDLFEYYYLDESRKSVPLCIQLAVLELKRTGRTELLGEMPSERTFQRWADGKIPRAVVKYYRYGEKACRDSCLPYIHRSYEDLHSNDIWVCDNHTFDLFVLEDGKPLRVYLTGFLDVRSRKMVGWHVTLSPSADATMYALRRGIEHYGIPKRILSDNGREFLTFDVGGRGFRKQARNSELDPETIMSRLGIEFHTAMVRNARAKIIERTFLTVKEEFSKLFEHYTGGNTLERPERLKKLMKETGKMSVLEDFAGFVDTWIAGYYNQRPTSAAGMRGMTPDQAFAKYLAEQRKAPAEELNLMLLRSTRMQKVRRDGVRLQFYGRDIWFVSDELVYSHLGEEVFVRYNPDDLSGVRIYDRNERFLMEASQDRQISYFASKEEVAQKMHEKRRLESVVKSYRKEKGIQATDALELVMGLAEENLRDNPEKLDPDIIRIIRSPEFAENMSLIQKAVGGDTIDWSIANQRIRASRNGPDGEQG